jgi:hypothetical protein
MMRGAAVPPGQHRLVYTYDPASSRIGAFVTMVGVVLSLALAWTYRRNPLGRLSSSEGEAANAAS